MNTLWLLVVLLLVAAGVLGDVALLAPAVLLASANILGSVWNRRAMQAVRVQRVMGDRSFMSDALTVRVHVQNNGRLPVAWLRLHDSAPAELGPYRFDQAINLKPREKRDFEYVIQATRRGYFLVGPLTLQSGDVLGLGPVTNYRAVDPAPLIVYPHIVPLEWLPFPSRMPLGNLRQRQLLIEDPSLMRGKREYHAGDSQRSIDWKSSAAQGRLQVKMFEPSVTLEAMVFLDLNSAGYDRMARLDSAELAIVLAASIANHWIDRKLPVGLATNGRFDPAFEQLQKQANANTDSRGQHAIPPRKGRSHFMRLLEVMASLTLAETEPISAVLKRELGHLAWGTSVVVITGKADDALLDELFRARRAGLSAAIVLCGVGASVGPVRRKAEAYGIQVHYIRAEKDVRRLTLVR